MANVDQLSGGRCILGVGWAREEFAALNVPFGKRDRMANEYLEAIRLLWTRDRASFDGEFVRFADVDTAPRPAQNPHPPIWVGGPSDAAMRRAIRYGDAWHPIRIREDWFRNEGIPRLTELADKEGKPVPALCPRIRMRLTDAPMPDGERVVGEGTVDQVRRDMAALQELGCEHVLLDSYYDRGDPEQRGRLAHAGGHGGEGAGPRERNAALSRRGVFCRAGPDRPRW